MEKSSVAKRSRGQERTRVGWREWVAFPDWGIGHIKAKLDTGARTSSLHVENLEWFERDGSQWVRFTALPWQRSRQDSVASETRLVATRNVKSSSGVVDHRPVVHAVILLTGQPVEIELTLTNRDEMGFRMLIGRQALRGRFVVDPGASYLGGRPTQALRRRNRGQH